MSEPDSREGEASMLDNATADLVASIMGLPESRRPHAVGQIVLLGEKAQQVINLINHGATCQEDLVAQLTDFSTIEILFARQLFAICKGQDKKRGTRAHSAW
jgi:hypothetical protein